MVLHNNAKMTLTFPALFQDSYDEKLHKQASFPSPLARGLQGCCLRLWITCRQTLSWRLLQLATLLMMVKETGRPA